MARILVADDDEGLRAVIRRALGAAGHVVEEATDGTEALTMYRTSPHDMVLLDLYMPGMDGLETIIRIKEEHPGARIVAVSGGGFRHKHDVLTMALQVGAVATLAKPFELSDLLGVASRTLAGEPAGGSLEAGARAGPSPTRRAVVLVVDDDAGTRRVLRKRLEAAGDRVIEAVDAETALRVFPEQEVDVLVADLLLPGTSGTELIEAVCKAHPDVGVVAISGDADQLSVVERTFADRAGVRTLPKPFTTPQLLEALDAVRGPREVRQSLGARVLARVRSLFSRA